jgi:hypothetical protein
MDRAVAQRIVDSVKALDPIWGQLDETSELMTDETERRAMRRALLQLIFDTWEKLAIPVFRQFPDMNYDRQTGIDKAK